MEAISDLRDAGLEYIDGEDCACLVNEWEVSGTDSNGNPTYEFIRKNPECSKSWVYLKEIIMEKLIITDQLFVQLWILVSSGGYGPVNL